MKTRDEINEIVTRVLIDKLGVDGEEVTENADLQNDLGMDSLDAVELFMEFEKEFNIQISDYDAEECHTVKDIIEYFVDQHV
jgi:acyl carrier protein